MSGRARTARPARSARRLRQQEVQRCLAEHALFAGPRRLSRGGGAAAAPDAGFGHRLRSALERLGPVFSSFAIYLGSRPDLLPLTDCLELAALPDRAPAASIGEVLALLAAELGCAPHDVYGELDEQPLASRLLVQAHRATLRGGGPVVVMVVRPGLLGLPGLPRLDDELEQDLELLGLLAAVPGPGGKRDRALAEAVEDFRRALPAMLDLAAQAAALESLAAAAREGGSMQVAGVVQELTRPRTITLHRPGGSPLEEVLQRERQAADDAGRHDLALAARSLAIAWLRGALVGSSFPVEPVAGLVLLPASGVAFGAGPFATPSAAFQGHLWSYLLAAAERDPDRACTHLLQEMSGVTVAGEDRLRLRLRQVVPFRDGAWSAGGESLAEHLFVHWRLAHESGFRPRAHLVEFYRGFFAVARAARRLAPERDVVAEALHEVRLISAVGQVRDLMSLGALRENLERSALAMAELPQRLDEVLTRAAAGGPTPQVRAGGASGASAPGRPGAVTVLVTAFLVAVTAVALLVGQLAGAGLSWADPAGAAVTALLGGLLLRGLRSRR